MPLVTLTASQRAAAMSEADSDLKWVWADSGVPDDIQAALAHTGYTRLRVFAGLGENRPEVKKALKEDIGLDAEEGLQPRQQVAVVLASWDATREFIAKDNEQRAEARASRVPRPVNASELTAMRNAFEAIHGRLENWEVPSRHYLGMKAEQIEENEPRPESLKEATSKDDGEEDILSADLDRGGSIKIRKGASETKLPSGPEELRIKLKVVVNGWLFLRTKHSNRPWLKDLEPQHFARLADHLLGKHVAGARIKGRDGSEVSPPWQLIINYEYEIRRKAYELVVMERMPLHEAVTTAMRSSELKEKHFTGPFLLGMMASSSQSTKREHGSPPPGSAQKYAKGAGRGQGGKGRGRGGSGKGKGKGMRSRTPDGRMICYKYNNEGEVCDGKCQMVHICQYCMEKHPAHACPKQAKAGPAQ
jgi:hypothetical protein